MIFFRKYIPIVLDELCCQDYIVYYRSKQSNKIDLYSALFSFFIAWWKSTYWERDWKQKRRNQWNEKRCSIQE